jgi:hypothetical protein
VVLRKGNDAAGGAVRSGPAIHVSGGEEFKVGDKVTVITTLDDSPRLVCSPRTIIAAVVQFPDSLAVYMVGHTDTPAAFNPWTFGPFTRSRLKVGW